MVVIHVKTADDQNQFLFESSTKEKVKDVVSAITTLHLIRLQALKVAEAAEALATYGPLRPEETRGLTEEVAKLSNLDVCPDGTPTNPDPHLYRTGVPPAKEVADVILRTCNETKEALSHKKVELRECLTLVAAKEALKVLEGALQIAYPANHGLPTWEPARLLLEGKETTACPGISESITLENACLWWTGKQLHRDECLSKYLGTNEKTRTVMRLQPNNAGPPVREPRMDAETHKAVLAYCHKKRQEDKAFAEDEDDSYLYSPWANPRGLKDSLSGIMGPIKWKV
ncbi:cilia- and flagella-associated protein 298 [Cyclospora cayetanensis]|uniref:Cilia- and flagella-associated protein 298 n=2 Tax=Cyclospora cayetanensis TaxID=88456 RepID=A0A6P5WCY2_9EIME|nr:cilia- and flagella-associated protein 298 [Cyclospora cayetanensis]OEH75426.1 hypothetical protein cyc_04809 [Cyclospora cayetanensis]